VYKKILVPLDGSELSEAALPFTEKLAGSLGSELVLLYVYESSDAKYHRIGESYLEKMIQILKNGAEKHLEKPGIQTIRIRSEILFGDFIRYLLQSTQGKIFLILDNAKWHHAKDLKEFFEANRDRLILIFLPAYSPELNPIERVWRITRRKVTHNRYFLSIEDLRLALVSRFMKWQIPNSVLKVLYARI
jgi:transposase